MKKCPFCSEEIQSEAIKCKFCLSDLTTTEAKKEVSKQKFKDDYNKSEDIKKELLEKISNRAGDSIKLKKYFIKNINNFDKLEKQTNEEIFTLINEKQRKNYIYIIYIIGIFLTFYSITNASFLGIILSFSIIYSIWLHPRKGEKVLAVKERLRNYGKYKFRIGATIFLFFIILMIIIGNIGVSRLEKSKEIEFAKQQIIEAKQAEEEKKDYSKPVITIISGTGLQATSTYNLIFSVTGAENVTVDGKSLSGELGEYSIPINIEEINMYIKIIANNKYYSSQRIVNISRKKTNIDVAAEKKAIEDARINYATQIEDTIKSIGDFEVTVWAGNGKFATIDTPPPFEVLVNTISTNSVDCFGAKNNLFKILKSIYGNPNLKNKVSRIQYVATYQFRASMGVNDTEFDWSSTGPSNLWSMLLKYKPYEDNTGKLEDRTYGVKINQECN